MLVTKDKKTHILKVLVGSYAHGLADESSDYDYRGVYVVPTTEILSLGFNYKGSHWLEGDVDQTAYEIGHLLHLATKCNPSILECFVAPHEMGKEEYNWGFELKQLFPYLWNPQDAYNAFTGYSLNQRKKMLDNHMNRWNKYGSAYIRTLYNLITLLQTGTFSLEVPEGELKSFLLQIRRGQVTIGDIINESNKLQNQAQIELERHKNGTANFVQEQDINRVNKFLLNVRKEFWE
jgi:predicted nucleotidyltransferase